jgi:DNA/RNA endonuclease G (NUC1)
MANDADFDYDEDVVRKTYTMANIVPQSPQLNQKTWIKAEKEERDMAEKYGSVTVVNKIIYPKKDVIIGSKHNLYVPSGFYKMIFNKRANFSECFYYDNEMPGFDNNGNQIMENIDGIEKGMIIETIDVDNDNLSDHKVDCRLFK